MGCQQIAFFKLQVLALAGILLAAACAAPSAAPNQAPAAPLATSASTPAAPPRTASPVPSATQQPGPTATAAPAPTHTPTPSFTSLCSPLEEIALAELDSPDLLKNPFQRPRPGMDDGHHGVDFAYWSRGARATMLDLPVYAALEGTVAGVLDNRIPYGYSVIIETPLELLPPIWLEQVAIPTPAPTLVPAGALYCPAQAGDQQPVSGKRSLYLLYAHFSQPPQLTVGQAVGCGEKIGLVGTTGNSVNYHLHLETRVGPAGFIFEQMAHYDNRATASEMGSYCTWRVSGLFQMFDPMEILALQP